MTRSLTLGLSLVAFGCVCILQLVGSALGQQAASPSTSSCAIVPRRDSKLDDLKPQRLNVSTSTGCLSCHTPMDSATMHDSPTVQLACVDCHGGDGAATTQERAHVRPRFANVWTSSAN